MRTLRYSFKLILYIVEWMKKRKKILGDFDICFETHSDILEVMIKSKIILFEFFNF